MIPIIDCTESVEDKSSEIFDAIKNVGFVYLKNFGISSEQIQEAFFYGKQIWTLPDAKKLKYSRPKNYEKEGNSGYVGENVELLSATSFREIRESYNFRPIDKRTDINEDIPEFYETLSKFSNQCGQLSLQILKIFAQNLALEDENYFQKCHDFDESATTLRLLHYPPVQDDIPPNTVRCGEHSDYGSITLLFQDDAGGLEVSDVTGCFVPADPVAETVLINTGDLMQRWTSGRIKAVKHRVLIPRDQEARKRDRYSIAYFVHPNDDFLIKPLDGSNFYEPITAGQHLINMFKKTY